MMGTLFYGGTSGIHVDDRTMEHLRLAMAIRLRRGESFMVSMSIDEPGVGSRRDLWVSPSIPLQFVYTGSRMPSINKLWIQAMGDTEDSTGTLTVMPENEAGSYLERKHMRLMNQLPASAPSEMATAS